MSARDDQFHELYRQLRIGDQLDFYERRRDEYRRAHRQAVAARNTLLILAAAAAAAAVFSDADRAVLGTAVVVFGALVAAVTAFEALIGFPQLSSLYRNAALSLKVAKIDWDQSDPADDLAGQVALVEEVFRQETEQVYGRWGEELIRRPHGQ